MGYYRYVVTGGEFVLRGDRYWQITFNGIQIGGLYRTPEQAVSVVAKRRSGQVIGPDLTGVEDPPCELKSWAADAPARS